MDDQTWNAIRPGAERAKDLGCTCPAEQPFHRSHGAYYQDPDCGLHRAHRFPSMGFVVAQVTVAPA